MGRDD